MNTIFKVLFIIIILFGCFYSGILFKSKQPKYKVYYEYNIFKSDTIPIDTIYIRIK